LSPSEREDGRMDEATVNGEILDRELGTKNIKKLFLKYGASTLVGMLAQAVMVMIEGVIIGNGLGALGLATVSIIMPLELLSLALGGAFGIGVSTISAIKLGEEKKEEAHRVFSEGFWLTTIITVVISVLIGINAHSVAGLLGATPDILNESTTFIQIFMIGFPFCVLGQVLCYMVRVDEKPGIATFLMTISSVIAIVELYYGVMVAKMGIVAVAIYYALSIGIWFLAIVYFLFGKTEFRIKLQLKMTTSDMKNMMIIGMPFFIVQISSFIFTWVVNVLLGNLGTSTDVASFGIINGYIFYNLNLVTTALTNGMQPIASYNYGAKFKKRLSELINVSVISNFVVIAGLTLLFALFSKNIIELFAGGDQKLVDVTSRNAVIMVCCSAFGLTSNIMSGYFQSIDNIKVSVILGISRFLFLAIPLMFLFSSLFGVDGVWYSQPVADMIVFGLSVIFIKKELQQLKIIKEGALSDEGR
jgi:Na+-driven multidrug efflux pump